MASPEKRHVSHVPVRGEAGFTLVELLVVMAVSLLMTTSFVFTFAYLSDATAQSIDSQNATANVRLAIAQLTKDLQEANPLLNLSSLSDYADSVEMALGPTGSTQQVVRWVLDTTPGSSTEGTLFRQVLSGSGSGATVESSYPEVRHVTDFQLGIPMFSYFGQGGENLVEEGAQADQVASCTVRVDVVVDVAPGHGAQGFSDRSDVELANTDPGSMPCG
jgi:prepilin-type N-terminal cleavage/methylation domain-containing protein